MGSSSMYISLICCMTLVSAAYTHMYDVHGSNHLSTLQQRRRQKTTENGLCAYARPNEIAPGISFTPRRSGSRQHYYAASHRTLPLGSLVNVDTGADSVTVRIADHRARPGHVLDLSAKAAESLHIDGDAPKRCTVTVVHVGRGGRRRRRNRLAADGVCKPTWSGTCRSAAECCSGRCTRVPGGARVCFPRHYRLRKVVSYAERTV